MSTRSWRTRAACAGTDLAMWFPNRLGAGHRAAAVDHAARLCDRCPVRAECEAESKGERWGIWAGRDMERPHQSTSVEEK